MSGVYVLKQTAVYHIFLIQLTMKIEEHSTESTKPTMSIDNKEIYQTQISQSYAVSMLIDAGVTIDNV